MPDTQASPPPFNVQYQPLTKAVFDDIARDELARGADPAERAREYAERGKPEFALAFLLLAPLADEEKRALYAEAHERRAANTERQAREFDRKFHRPFPLLTTEAAHDRALARQIRAGQVIAPGAGKHLPMV